MKKTKKILLLSAPILLLPIVAGLVVSCSEQSNSKQNTTNIPSITSNSSSNSSIINSYVNTINSLPINTITVNPKNQNILPSQCNSTNLLGYLDNVPTINTNIIYNIVILSANDNNGTLVFNISFPESNSVITTMSIYVNGFLTNNQANINTFINQINTIGPTLTGNNNIYPQQINNSNVLTYLVGMPSTPIGVTLTYTIFNSNNGNGDLQIIISASATNAIMVSSNEITISGFKSNVSILKTQIENINLQANKIMPAPIITTSTLALENAQSILMNFNISSSQTQILNQIKDLSISVTNSSIANGTATLEFSANIDGYTTTYSQSYSGFFAGTVDEIKTYWQTFLSTSNNVVSFLQNYLNFNQSFLDNLVIKQAMGSTYWSYLPSSSNINNFSDIKVSYDTSSKTYVIDAMTVNAINVSTYENNGFVPGSTIPVGTQLVITLPFIFSGTLTNYSSMNLSVSDSGGVTLSWVPAQFTSYQQTIGIITKYIPKGSTTLQNLTLPWRTPIIPTISF